MNCRIESPRRIGCGCHGQQQGVSCTQADCRVLLLDARLEAAPRMITGGTFDSTTRRGGCARRDLRSAHRGSATLVALV
jgi:hypothetical protein